MKRALCLIAVFFPATALANLDDSGTGARAPGMANAFVAVADEASALQYNPAGLVQLNGVNIAMQHARLLPGLSDSSSISSNYIGGAVPLKGARWGVVGLSYRGFRGSNYFDDREISIGYAGEIPGRLDGLSLGFAIKQFHREYQPDMYTKNALNDAGNGTGREDPLFAHHGYSNDKVGFDAGALWRYGDDDQWSLGALVRNLNQADMSMGGDGDTGPLGIRVGLAYRPRWGAVTAEVGRTKRLASGPDQDSAIGAERNVMLKNVGALGVRGGLAQGSRHYRVVTAGVSFQMATVRIDYAFGFPIGKLSTGSGEQRIALSLRFRPSVERPTSSVKVVGGTEHFFTLKDQYFIRRAQGAGAEERLAILQKLYLRSKEEGVDLKWLADELSSL